jgi:hypothetical protein
MGVTEMREERRSRDRSQGIVLRRRLKRLVDANIERRRGEQSGFDIAAALELHLDQCTTRRPMLTLLESWLAEANSSAAGERDEDYTRAIERAIEVMKSAPDPLTAIAVLQRRSSG